MTDETAAKLEKAVEACDRAREALEEALQAVDQHDGAADDDTVLEPIGEALSNWRDAQHQFTATVEEADVPDVATAAMVLKMNHGVDATNARRGLPGTTVEGTDKPFDLDLSGNRGTALTTAATQYVE
jgi:hypothetical protein